MTMTEIETLTLPGRSREDDMETLANAWMSGLQRDTSSYDAWAVDAKRPFGFSAPISWTVAHELQIESNGDTADAVDAYCKSLWAALGPYIQSEWIKRARHADTVRELNKLKSEHRSLAIAAQELSAILVGRLGEE